MLRSTSLLSLPLISAGHSTRRLRFFTGGVLPCRYVLRQAVDPDVLERWLTPAEGGEPERGGSGGSTLLKLRAGEISIHDCREQSSAAPLRTACCPWLAVHITRRSAAQESPTARLPTDRIVFVAGSI